MAFNINDFTTELSKNGLAKTSNFKVVMSGDPLKDIFPDAGRDFSFRIESVDFPGRSIPSLDYKDYGAPYKIGGLANYIEITFVIICSSDLREREFFMRWQDLITGNHRQGKKRDFDIGYYDEYVCKKGFEISQYDDIGNETYKISLIDSYPTLIGALSGSWATTDIQKMTVTMSYRYFEEKSIPSLPSSSSNRIPKLPKVNLPTKFPDIDIASKVPFPKLPRIPQIPKVNLPRIENAKNEISKVKNVFNR